MSRSSKKGPWVEERLMGRIEAMNASNQRQMIRTWSRASTIFPDMVGHTIDVHVPRPRRERQGPMNPDRPQDPQKGTAADEDQADLAVRQSAEATGVERA